jgi:prevent-host-death family protein
MHVVIIVTTSAVSVRKRGMATAGRVGIRELKANPGKFVRLVRDTNVPIDVTVRGEVVARIVPVYPPPTAEEVEAAWRRHDEIAKEISAVWPKGVSAMDAVNEVRREL